MNRTALAVACLACCTHVAAGQVTHINVNVRRGLTSAWALGMIVDEGLPTPSVDDAIVVKGPRDQVGPGGAPIPPGPMNGEGNGQAFLDAVTALNDFLPLGSMAHPIVLDAVSSGNAIIPDHDGDGVPKLTSRWLALTVSISNGGGTGGQTSHFAEAHAAGRNTGSEIPAYVFGASEGVNKSLPGTVLLSANRDQLGLPASTDPDIKALDFAIGVRQHTPGGVASEFFGRDNAFFFSVSSAWAATYNQHHSGGFAQNERVAGNPLVPANGADIYVMFAGSSGWEGPFLWAPAAHLGLTTGVPDIDALDVDQDAKNVIFSTVGVPLGQQLMIANLSGASTARFANATEGGTPGPMPLQDKITPLSPPRKVTDIVAPEEDEIDALCAVDPEGFVAGRLVGIPREQPLSFGAVDPMGLSLVKQLPDSGNGDPNHYMSAQLTGWGEHGPRLGIVSFWMRRDALPFNQIGPYPGYGWERIHTMIRHSHQDTVEHLFTIPDGPDLDDAVKTVWVTMADRAGRKACSWPCAIRLD